MLWVVLYECKVLSLAILIKEESVREKSEEIAELLPETEKFALSLLPS
jgi:hypothetical protein